MFQPISHLVRRPPDIVMGYIQLQGRQKRCLDKAAYVFLLINEELQVVILGGITGDCLGAAQQLAEVLLYLLFAATLV